MFTNDEKAIILTAMLRRYNKGAYTHNYIFGFARNKMIYAVQVDNANDLLSTLTYIEKRSDNWSLRYRPTKAQQEIILANASRVEILGTADWLETEKLNFKNNRGDAFEYHACKRWDGTQPTKRNEKFTESGDFWMKDGKHYQCKFGASTGAATFTDETTLARLGL